QANIISLDSLSAGTTNRANTANPDSAQRVQSAIPKAIVADQTLLAVCFLGRSCKPLGLIINQRMREFVARKRGVRSQPDGCVWYPESRISEWRMAKPSQRPPNACRTGGFAGLLVIVSA